MTRQLLLCAVAGMALAACAGPEVEVRRIASPLSQEDLSIADRLAEAAGQMRLGNTGLAIESYRKALRKSPKSALAHVGMAGAYDRMGRYDLSLDHYQMALALRPDDPRMYAALAGSLKAQGRPVDAARVMAEAQMRASTPDVGAAAPIAASVEQAARSLDVVPEPMTARPVTNSVTVQLPKARPLADTVAPGSVDAGEELAALGDKLRRDEQAVVLSNARAGAVRMAPSVSGSTITIATSGVPVVHIASLKRGKAALPQVAETRFRPSIAASPIEVKSLPLDAPVMATLKREAREVPLAPPPIETYATMATARAVLSPAAPVIRGIPMTKTAGIAPTPANPAVMLSAPKTVRKTPAREAAIVQRSARLERMSGGEVALLLTDKPAWESRVVERTPTSTTVQFTRARVEAPAVMLIAAGGEMRLAERARETLRGTGVDVAETDTSPTARSRSVLFFPKGREEDAKALVRRFGFRIAAQVGPVEVMTLHLGKDAEAALLGA